MKAVAVMDTTIDRNDPLLGSLLDAVGTGKREEVIAELLTTHVYWRVERILSSRFAQSGLDRQHHDDVRNEILLRVVDRLHGLATSRSPTPIESFPDYVSVVAFNTFDELARQASPLTTRLRNRVRYALGHDPRLAMWKVAGATFCGLSEWKGASEVAQRVETPSRVRHRGGLTPLLRALFEETGKPVVLETLVTFVADIHGITDREAPCARSAEVAAAPDDPIERLANLQYLHKLWEEICNLPLRQRIALLFNARDAGGESVMRFLPLVGVASIRQIGSSLAIEAEELADLWPELPLEDTRIAVILNVTRQQVINLRSAARERLQRRLGGKR